MGPRVAIGRQANNSEIGDAQVMTAWERRLKDLAQTLANCASTYFDPDAFRMNVNHFLQTSRTVTFIIQKDKAKIPNFIAWYDANVLKKWRGDVVMDWARDSRNIIEKEGDLDLNSTLAVTSYSRI